MSLDMRSIIRFRNFTKLDMIRERGGMFDCKCDLCQKSFPGQKLHMHELVNRARTINNDEARAASYSKYICSLLCHDCHGKAHNTTIRNILFESNIKRYTREKVQASLDHVQKYMKTNLNIELPEINDAS